jgi:hypothetical protein
LTSWYHPLAGEGVPRRITKERRPSVTDLLDEYSVLTPSIGAGTIGAANNRASFRSWN